LAADLRAVLWRRPEIESMVGFGLVRLLQRSGSV